MGKVRRRNCCAVCRCSIAFRFGMLDRRLISVDGKPVEAYLLQNDAWAILNSMHWPDPTTPLRAVLSHFASIESEMGAGLAGCPRPLEPEILRMGFSSAILFAVT